MSLEEIIARIGRDQPAHTASGPAQGAELAHLEHDLGHPLPPPLRTFLAQVGGGIFYGRHEIFGVHRVMIHDIELLPSLRSVVQYLNRGVPAPPPGWLPFHRCEGTWHLIELGGQHAVMSWPAATRHAGLEDFLRDVVCAAAGGG